MPESLHAAYPLPRAAAGFTWTRTTAGHLLVCEPLAELALHGWTTKQLELQGPEEACAPQWTRLAATLRVEAEGVRRMNQVHGTTVLEASRGARQAPTADGLMSDDPSLLLSVRVADCVPVLLADRDSGAVAAVHAGWRGTAVGIVREAVERMRAHFGTRPQAIVAALGPSIGGCHYEVGPDVEAAFRAAGWEGRSIARWFGRVNGSLRLDVAAANADQLREAGVHAESIYTSGLCTACHPAWFYSYRRDGRGTGRLAGVIRAARRAEGLP